MKEQKALAIQNMKMSQKPTTIPITEMADGQFSFIPEMPTHVQKARSPVIDRVMNEGLAEQTQIVLDETAEITVETLPIMTRVMLDYDGIDIDTQGLVHLNAFDREVLDAVASLIECNDYITPEMIFRVMLGKRKCRYVTEQQKAMVKESLMRCSHARLQISLTDMAEKGSPIGRQLKKYNVEAKYSEPLLTFKSGSVRLGERVSERYYIMAKPVFFRYAESLGKISVFPIELIDTKVNKTAKNIVLQSFLLRTIDEMYRDAALPRRIGIQDIYNSVDAINQTRKHKARIRDTVNTILGCWVDKDYIRGYELYQTNTQIKGYEIQLKDRMPFTF